MIFCFVFFSSIVHVNVKKYAAAIIINITGDYNKGNKCLAMIEKSIVKQKVIKNRKHNSLQKYQIYMEYKYESEQEVKQLPTEALIKLDHGTLNIQGLSFYHY